MKSFPSLSISALVAQIFNLLYRRFAIGRRSKATGLETATRARSRAQQVANLRYSRLQICATQAASILALLVTSTLILAGCGKGSLAVHDSGAFQQAAPELKTLWQTAVAAAGTNGYLAAYTTLETLRTQSSLNAEQAKEVEQALGQIGTRMFNAANAGDPEATRALKEVQNASKRR